MHLKHRPPKAPAFIFCISYYKFDKWSLQESPCFPLLKPTFISLVGHVLHQKITQIWPLLTFLAPLFLARSDHPSPTCLCAVCCAKSLQLCLTLLDPVDCSPQAPLSVGFSRQEYWSGLPCPPWDIPDPGVKPKSLNASCIDSQVYFLFCFVLFWPLMPLGKPFHDSNSLSFLIFIF